MPIMISRLGWAWAALLVPLGAALWTFGEYVLHRFAMHELKGRGKLSSEHLEHHVRATWQFDPLIMFAWLGVILVGVFVWGPVAWVIGGPVAAASVAVGWMGGYAYYEYQHAQSHLRGPRSRYTRWLRRHHFHHHFGHPMANHGVTTLIWDKAFGTFEAPTVVKVPRRMAPTWLVDAAGQILPAYTDDYVLVGAAERDERLADLDRVRAFASLAPVEALA